MLSITNSANANRTDPEYSRIFNFLLIFKAASIVYAILIFYIAKQPLTPLILGVFTLITIYTAVFVLYRNQLYTLLISKPSYYFIDVFIAVVALLSATQPSIPFYNYSAATVVTGTMIFTLRQNLWMATILSIAQMVSASLNGLPISSTSGGIAMIIGEIFAYFIIAFFGNYIAKLFTEVFTQRKIIKDQAERQATIEERNRLARDMHDNLAQILAGIKFRSEALKDISKSTPYAEYADSITGATKEGLQALREALFALREDTFESNLSEVITRYSLEFASNIGFKITTDFEAEPQLPQSTKAELFRICQEAIHNANKHSGKKEAHISFALNNGNFETKITDQGNGFELGAHNKSGLGLKSMQERADKLGAVLTLDSKPGFGTIICVKLPVDDFNKNFVLSEN